MQRLVSRRAAAELASEQDHAIGGEAHVHLARRCRERAGGDRSQPDAVGPPDRQVRRERARLEVLTLLERGVGQVVGEGRQAIRPLRHANPQAPRAREVREGTATGQPDTDEFLKRLFSFLGYVLPRYVREGKSYLTIGIGCTGGRHRSVMLTHALAQRLEGRGHAVRTRHRDLRLS